MITTLTAIRRAFARKAAIIGLRLAAFAATSEGEPVVPLAAPAKQVVWPRRYQRAFTRKGVGGIANRNLALSHLGVPHRRIASQRATGQRL